MLCENPHSRLEVRQVRIVEFCSGAKVLPIRWTSLKNIHSEVSAIHITRRSPGRLLNSPCRPNRPKNRRLNSFKESYQCMGKCYCLHHFSAKNVQRSKQHQQYGGRCGESSKIIVDVLLSWDRLHRRLKNFTCSRAIQRRNNGGSG